LIGDANSCRHSARVYRNTYSLSPNRSEKKFQVQMYLGSMRGAIHWIIQLLSLVIYVLRIFLPQQSISFHQHFTSSFWSWYSFTINLQSQTVSIRKAAQNTFVWKKQEPILQKKFSHKKFKLVLNYLTVCFLNSDHNSMLV